MWNNNNFFDGKKLEQKHIPGKDKQTKHDNHQQPFKKSVTEHSVNVLRMRYVVGGGHWGPNLEYCLGKKCLALKDPKNCNLPNIVMKNYMMPRGCTIKLKFNVTQYYGDVKQNRENPLSRKSTTAIANIVKHGEFNQLMAHINSACPDDSDLTWHELLANKLWSIKEASAFRFHHHHSTFKMRLHKHAKCLMKTNNNHVFQFTNVYCFKYKGEFEVLLGFGNLWPIHASITPDEWNDDNFDSFDFVKNNERKRGWYFCSNLVEPVFLLHECVSFDDIRANLPFHWRHQSSEAFYHNFAFNMRKLLEHRDEFECSQVRRSIELPCGPVFCCQKHNRIRCNVCVVADNVYDQRDWQMKWKCNDGRNSRMRVFDSKQGLCMTLMKTVTDSHKFIY